MNTELIDREQGINTLTARNIRAQVNLIQEVLKEVMKEGTHFGIIPGCPKPSLFKPGAEKIAVTFRIAVKSEVEDLSTADEKRYRVTCTAYALDGSTLGSSTGECSSNEEKYRWRRPVCAQEFDEADSDRKREVWKNVKGQTSKIKQIRTEPSDLANTILQMADKRAYVAVVRKVTAASDVFTQDIEDLPPEVQADIAADAQVAPAGKPAVSMPKEKQPETATEYVDVIALTTAQVGDKFNLKAYVRSVKSGTVPKKDKSGTLDLTEYAIGDLPKDATMGATVKVFAKAIAVKAGNAIKFNGLEVSMYKEQIQYTAKEAVNG